MSLEGAKKLSSLQAAQNLETGKQYSKERERERVVASLLLVVRGAPSSFLFLIAKAISA